MMESSKRNYKIDLIKSIAIILIVLYHCTEQQSYWGYVGSQYKIIQYFVGMGGSVGNVLFVLCTGYLLSEKRIKRNKALKLYIEVLFYSILAAVVLNLIYKDNINWSDTFMPFSRNYYWFFTSYIIMFLLLPFINILLEKLDNKTFKELLITELIFFSVIPTIIINNKIFYISTNNTMTMVMVYTLGYYIKKYKPKVDKKGLLFLILEIYAIMVGSEYWLALIKRAPAYFVWDWSKTTVILLGVLMFLLCISLDQKSRFLIRITKMISKHTFAIYIIHSGLLKFRISKLIVFLRLNLIVIA